LRLEIKVFPKSSREELVKADGVIKAYIKAAPDKGKANKALIDLISKEYKVKKSDVRVVIGKTSRNKVVEILNSKEKE
jgi:uncharacterized protein (TIGR00251 family)